jgi:3-hydroxyacyl-CoA dehydrogenase/enoyl-CoA hydratase/3-hydroxybutyryl-CoA epimerase
MGPVELADQVGLDICLHVGEMLADSLDTPMAAIPDWLRKKVERGELGRKSGQGFYVWKNGRAQKQDKPAAAVAADSSALADRLLLPMLNACVECYRQQVVTDLEHIDAAMIFATGFPPFRGGPLHYARARGIEDIVKTLESLAVKHGERFRPDPGWNDME